MVVTRRTPVAPGAPASRTNSSQPIPRAAKGKAPQTGLSVASDAGASNLDPLDSGPPPKGNGSGKGNQGSTVSPSKSKQKQKQKSKKKKQRAATIDFIARIFLLLLTIYALSFCPSDTTLSSPVCRGLASYRDRILDPYIISPFNTYLLPRIHTALSHPTVAPYVTTATHYVDVAKPHVDRTTQNFIKPALKRSKKEWDARVVPRFHKHVTPQWNKHVVPRYHAHITPHVNTVQTTYNTHLAPHIARASRTLTAFQVASQPYVHFVAVKVERGYAVAAANTHRGYVAAKPHALVLWARMKVWARIVARWIVLKRREFVDPHVKRIWEKVGELSTRKAGRVGSEFGSHGGSHSVTPEVVKIKDAGAVGDGEPAVETSVSSIEPTAPVTATSAASSASSAGSTSVSLSASEAPSPEVIPPPTDDPARSAASIVSESLLAPSASVVGSTPEPTELGSASEVIPAVAASTSPTVFVEGDSDAGIVSNSAEGHDSVEMIESVSSVVAASASGASSVVASLTEELSASSVSATPTSSSPPSRGEEDEDLNLDEFVADLGLDLDGNSESPEGDDSTPPAEQPPIETEEEKAERLRLKALKTAEKRADITARHTSWEKQLEDLVKEKKKLFRKALVALRKGAVGELKENQEIRGLVEGLASEGERLLKGAEGYLKNLNKDQNGGQDAKAGLWEKVVGKVESKFVDKLREVEGTVHAWYVEQRDLEVQEVLQVSLEVKLFAEKAQANLGLDYAWLDDVTYEDWQRYHDLVRTSERFSDAVRTIQNGTHPSPPIDPLLPALNDLQSEVQDIVAGFEIRLHSIKRSGERAFGATVDEEGYEEDDVDGEVETEAHEPEPEPAVSILPIPNERGNGNVDDDTDAGESAEVPPVFIGRNKEEVLEALGRVSEGAQVASGGDGVGEGAGVLLGAEKKAPQEVAEGLVQEDGAAQVPEHVEL